MEPTCVAIDKLVALRVEANESSGGSLLTFCSFVLLCSNNLTLCLLISSKNSPKNY